MNMDNIKDEQGYMIIDTETTLKSRLAFNIAYQLVTPRGYQTEKKDFWLDEILVDDEPFLKTSKPSTAKSVTKEEIITSLEKDEKKVKSVWAYNSPFDKRALKATLGFEFKKPVKDLWTAAAVYICDEEYIDWARENDKITSKGNVETSAETVYQFVSGVTNFEEFHTAYQDTQCEKEILKILIAKGVDLDALKNHGAPWRIVKKRAEKMDKTDREEALK